MLNKLIITNSKSSSPQYVMNQVLLLHENAGLNTSLCLREVLATIGWIVLTLPHYSPDLAPSKIHVFGSLMDAVRGRRFAEDELKYRAAILQQRV
jgi:hypothetical protein